MKLLIVSHNPITTYEAMGKTMMTLFSAFRREELCQLYIYPTLPDIDYCNAYFRVTDKDVLRSYLTFSVKGAEIPREKIGGPSLLFENERDEGLYRNRKNKKPLRMLLRDAMWRFSHWYTRALREFLDREKPSVLFVAPGTGKFLYRMALKIAADYHLPIVTYIGDDYYFLSRPKGLLARYQHYALQRVTRRLMAKSRRVVTICKRLEELWGSHFHVPCDTIMTGASFPISEEVRVREERRAITYLGNVRCDRYLSLREIGEALDLLNERHGTSYTLDVYSAERSQEILSVMTEPRAVRFCGYVSGQDFLDKLFGADLLLHTEAFDEVNMDYVKNSVSTKIADSLACGVPLLAYAPPSLASMEHLETHRAALTATDKAALLPMLEHALLGSGEELSALVVRALAAAHDCHDPAVNSRRLYEIMEACCENSAD